MKRIMIAIMAGMLLVGFSAVSFADDKGDHKGMEMKGDAKGEKKDDAKGGDKKAEKKDKKGK
jgi:uncharacterized protein YxeA